MGIHKCPNCKNEYHNKMDLDAHIKKNLCKKSSICKKKITIHKCDECGRLFDRKFSYDRHVKNVHAEKTTIIDTTNTTISDNINIQNSANINIQKNDVKCRDIIHNTNNIYVNQYDLIPFCKDDASCLTIREQLDILLNHRGELMKTIIIQINFNPDKKNNHNFFYNDLKSGYGKVFDGKCWKPKKIKSIIDALCTAREKDLWNIFEACQMHISPADVKELKEILTDIGHFLRPDKSNSFHLDSQKLLRSDLKGEFIARCIYGVKAFNSTKHLFKGTPADEVPINDTINNPPDNSEYTFDVIAAKVEKTHNLKEIAKSLLESLTERLNKETYNSLELLINKTFDDTNLDIIITLLTESLWKDKQIDTQIIMKAYETRKTIDEFMKKNYPDHFI